MIADEQRFGKAFLDDIREWIADYFDIDEVFSEKRIKEFLSQCSVDAFIDESELHAWAQDQGYVEEE